MASSEELDRIADTVNAWDNTTTAADVENAVALLAAISHDEEYAHVAEDGIHEAVLRVTANGHPNPAPLAAEALKTAALGFSRWYA